MSVFDTCEFCDELGGKLCNCSSPPRFCCNNHMPDHMSSKKGVLHPFEDALVDLSEEESLLLKQAVGTYQIEVIRQVISRKNTIVNYFLEKIRRAEEECSSIIESVLNSEIKVTVQQLAFRKSLPLFSSSSFLKTLVSLKQSQAFSLPEILKELLSSSSLSSLDRIFSTKEASFQACPHSVSSHSQVISSHNLSIASLSSFLLSPQPPSISSSSSQTFPSFSLSHFSTYTCSAINILGKTKKNKETETTIIRAIEKQKEITVDMIPRWELSHLIEAHTGNTYTDSNENIEITCIAVSDCRQYFASASRDKTIKIWDTKFYTLLRTLNGHSNRVLSASFLGTKIVSGSCDKTIKIWEEEKCINTISLHSDEVTTVCVSSSKRLIASGSFDKTVIVFDIESNLSLHTLRSHSNRVSSVVFSDNDREIVSGSDDCTIKVWKTETGELLRTLNGHEKRVACVRTLGKLIVSSSDDECIKVWERDREERLICLKGHTKKITSVDFSKKTVFSISYDNSIRIWDLENGKQIQSLQGHGSASIFYIDYRSLGSLKILEEGHLIISGGADGRIKIWKRIR